MSLCWDRDWSLTQIQPKLMSMSTHHSKCSTAWTHLSSCWQGFSGHSSSWATAAEPQQSWAPSTLTVLIRVSHIGFTGCAELQTSFSRLMATFQTMTASLKLAQVCSTFCCGHVQRYKQICCVWESAEWSVQFQNTSEHPISAHTGQNHSHFWHSCE